MIAGQKPLASSEKSEWKKYGRKNGRRDALGTEKVQSGWERKTSQKHCVFGVKRESKVKRGWPM